MFEEVFLKKYPSERHHILWQSGEMVEVCSVLVCVSEWCQSAIWSAIPVFTCSNKTNILNCLSTYSC